MLRGVSTRARWLNLSTRIRFRQRLSPCANSRPTLPIATATACATSALPPPHLHNRRPACVPNCLRFRGLKKKYTSQPPKVRQFGTCINRGGALPPETPTPHPLPMPTSTVLTAPPPRRRICTPPTPNCLSFRGLKEKYTSQPPKVRHFGTKGGKK